MTQYINKDAFVAEIENLENTYKKCPTRNSYEEGLKDGRLIGYKDALHKINTIEVKEIGVDLGDPKGDKSAKHIIDTKTLEVKEVDLDFMLHEYWVLYPKVTIDCLESATMTKDEMIRFAKHFIGLGAKWKEEQLEKNRLHHCEALTDEQAQIESDFVSQHLKENNRTPTFIDAIEYGMRLQREDMMKDALDAVVHIDAGNYPYIPQLELYDYDKDIPLAEEGDKYKVVLIKED